MGILETLKIKAELPEERKFKQDTKLLEAIGQSSVYQEIYGKYQYTQLKSDISLAKWDLGNVNFWAADAAKLSLSLLWDLVQTSRDEQRLTTLLAEVSAKMKRNISESELYNQVRLIFIDYSQKAKCDVLLNVKFWGFSPIMRKDSGLKLTDQEIASVLKNKKRS